MTGENVLVRSVPPRGALCLPLDEVVRRLREALSSTDVQEAYVFGSLVSGETHPWSDVDLILVVDSDEPFVERPRRFWNLLKLGFPLDILVYTPSEFRALWENPIGFWRSVRESHVRVL